MSQLRIHKNVSFSVPIFILYANQTVRMRNLIVVNESYALRPTFTLTRVHDWPITETAKSVAYTKLDLVETGQTYNYSK